MLREVDASDTLIAGGGHDCHVHVIDATTATMLTSQNVKSVVSSVLVHGAPRRRERSCPGLPRHTLLGRTQTLALLQTAFPSPQSGDCSSCLTFATGVLQRAKPLARRDAPSSATLSWMTTAPFLGRREEASCPSISDIQGAPLDCDLSPPTSYNSTTVFTQCGRQLYSN